MRAKEISISQDFAGYYVLKLTWKHGGKENHTFTDASALSAWLYDHAL